MSTEQVFPQSGDGPGRLSAEVRKISVVVLTIIAALATHFYLYGYPALVELLIDEAERDAIHAAKTLQVIVKHEQARGGSSEDAQRGEIDSVREALGVLKFKIFDADGRVVDSSDPEEVGHVNQNGYFREIVAAGRMHSHLFKKNEPSLDGQTYVRDVVEIYVPTMVDGRFEGAFEIYYDITALRQNLDGRLSAINVSFAGVLVTLLALFVVVVVRSFTAALRAERENSRRLHDEIEQRLRVEEELRESHGHFRHLAHHDPLTGLPNRTLFLDRFAHALANARRYQTRLALLFVDLDRFKAVNDTYGHKAGDRILRAAATVLQHSVRESDTAARIAGDEFAVLIEHADEATVDVLVSRLVHALASGLELDDGGVSTSASIGVSFFPEDGDDLETLLHRADIAMYRAKAERRGSWQYFSRASDVPEPSGG